MTYFYLFNFFFMKSSSTVLNCLLEYSVVACFLISWKIFKNSGVPNFCCASWLFSRIFFNACEIHPTVLSSLASGMMKENASTTGSELRRILEDGLSSRMLLMEIAVQHASLDALER